MKLLKVNDLKRNLLTVATTVGIILIAAGIFGYYYFFRQSNAQLIETVPIDAAFVYQINDNKTFVKEVQNIRANISPFFGLDALPGCQFFLDQLPGKYNQLIFSGHVDNNKINVLFACKINKKAFEQLLQKLQIDVANSISFENCKIYSYGTHLKRFVFTYHNQLFCASEDITLLKKSISQLKNPKNLTSSKSLGNLCGIIEKNKIQNWLIINNEKYLNFFSTFCNEEMLPSLIKFSNATNWSINQVRFSGNEMFLSGYYAVNEEFYKLFSLYDNKKQYFSSASNEQPVVAIDKVPLLKYAQSRLPSSSYFEYVIHSESPEYWLRFFSPEAIQKSTLKNLKLFVFSIDSLQPKMATSTTIIKF